VALELGDELDRLGSQDLVLARRSSRRDLGSSY
jgi:hypothetical protein